jgi:hypothetical protein
MAIRLCYTHQSRVSTLNTVIIAVCRLAGTRPQCLSQFSSFSFSLREKNDMVKTTQFNGYEISVYYSGGSVGWGRGGEKVSVLLGETKSLRRSKPCTHHTRWK